MASLIRSENKIVIPTAAIIYLIAVIIVTVQHLGKLSFGILGGYLMDYCYCWCCIFCFMGTSTTFWMIDKISISLKFKWEEVKM